MESLDILHPINAELLSLSLNKLVIVACCRIKDCPQYGLTCF